MNIYFGEAKDESDTSGLFQVEDEYFYYMVSVNSDSDIVITDTCGRYMPISPDALSSLMNALDYIAPHMEFIDLVNSDTNLIF